MRILGIESSCDDTSVALLDCSEEGFVVLAEKTASQIDIHKKYGGVVPELAGRMHAEAIVPLVEEVLKTSLDAPSPHGGGVGVGLPDVIAVTAGPGLVTGLLVGVEAAKSLSYLWDIPLVRVNHIEGHIYSVLLEPNNSFIFPALCLIVSGGHTELLLMKNHDEYALIGKTRDDAAGECFDKVAKLLDLEYPGGPKISKLAVEGNTKAIDFPRPMLDSNTIDFSFAGLKTAALYWLRDNTLDSKKDFCASFEQAIVDVLVSKTMRAIEHTTPKTVILSGGVSANKKLRETLQQACSAKNIPLLTPSIQYSMDNGAMIALAGYFHARKKDFTHWKDIDVDPNWHVYE